jgi:hypothetical protein
MGSPATLGAPTFDPYAASPATMSGTPFPPAYPGQTIPPGAVSPGGMFPMPTATTVPPAAGFPAASPYGTVAAPSAAFPTGYPVGAYPAGAVPQAAFPTATGVPGTYAVTGPQSMFPNGVVSPTGTDWVSQTYYGMRRAAVGIRGRYALVTSFDPDVNTVNSNDIDVSIPFAWRNFLGGTQPLYLVPSFGLHLWDGPNSSTGADLPGNTYDAFLDIGWNSDFNCAWGAELGARLGVFTDWDTFESESFRVMGQALGRMRLTPTSTLKLGVIYVNRNSVKLLPAGGILCQPTPQSRWDIYFPDPRVAHYMSSIGNNDLWWYFGATFGGGTWTITRADGDFDSFDLNDIRVVGGFEWGPREWMQSGRRLAFAEIGWVTNRKLKYRYTPGDDLDLTDAFMFRIGIGY